jgi:hypothetical protein
MPDWTGLLWPCWLPAWQMGVHHSLVDVVLQLIISLGFIISLQLIIPCPPGPPGSDHSEV